MQVSVPRCRSQANLESDLPLQQLRELFNVNHFVISQASPYVAPALFLKETIRESAGLFASKVSLLSSFWSF
jgi:TAG lipase/steryl ester hydrolase/phospholipase A2/LPA acyltransferase